MGLPDSGAVQKMSLRTYSGLGAVRPGSPALSFHRAPSLRGQKGEHAMWLGRG